MGFQGQLSSVNLSDILQTLQVNHQTGALVVGGGDDAVRVWFDQGQIAACYAPIVDNLPYLLRALLQKGLIPPEQARDFERRNRETGQPLRELLEASGTIGIVELDEVCAWCIEEIVCPIFERTEGEFAFTDGEPPPELLAATSVWMGALRLQTTQLLLEATRRKDEWQRIREVITDPAALLVVDNDGRANLRNLQTDPDMLKVLRYLDGRHTIDSIAEAVGVTRFDCFTIAAQLVLAGVARTCTAQEVVEDAVRLKTDGDCVKAGELLENVLRTAKVPEVLRPLAEISIQINQIPRAVELYLDLIQLSQDQGDLEAALTDLNTVIGLSPDDPDLHFERAQVLADLGHIEQAAAGYGNAAQAYLATKDVNKAIDSCHRAKNLLPRAPEPHRYLARAYLLEGQTENAAVEYKALWHALLTITSPRKALEELRVILDSDCKYPAIKDQVLSHAQNSEAVKTSRATRLLVYVVLILLLIVGASIGWLTFSKLKTQRDGREALHALDDRFARERESLPPPHGLILDDISQVQFRYRSSTEVTHEAATLTEQVRSDWEARSKARIDEALALGRNGRFEAARNLLLRTQTEFRGTDAAAKVDSLVQDIQGSAIKVEVVAKVEEAKRKWQDLDWDGAVRDLKPILDRSDLPPDLRSEYQGLSYQWTAALASSDELGKRADRIADRGDRRAAIAAFRRAASGQGEAGCARARSRLAGLELDDAKDIATRARDAAQRGDDAGAFAAVELLQNLARDSIAISVRDFVANLELPFTLRVDHQATVLTLHRAGTATTVRRPQDAVGAWSQMVPCRLSEEISGSASRTGFTTLPFTISIKDKRTQIAISLRRGPRWSVPLAGAATFGPVSADRFAVLGTSRATFEIVDAASGNVRAVPFPDCVTEFRLPAAMHQGRAYLLLDDRVAAIDVATRNLLWTWPPERSAIRQNFKPVGGIGAGDHELIQGQILLYLGSGRSQLTILAVDGTSVVAYPRLLLPNDLSGQPTVGRHGHFSVLTVPAGNQLVGFDVTAITESTKPRQLFSIRTRGDLEGVPQRVRVKGRPALLLCDISGQLVAVDTDPEADDNRRVLGSWAVDGVRPSTPVILPGGKVAVTATSDGRVVAIDLERPGHILWRHPQTGNLAQVPGQVGVGRNTIYVADVAGILHAIDPATGSGLWRADLGSPACASVWAADGRILVPVRSGALLCFDEGD